jgi:hypothetical protein
MNVREYEDARLPKEAFEKAADPWPDAWRAFGEIDKRLDRLERLIYEMWALNGAAHPGFHLLKPLLDDIRDELEAEDD